jgi:hypothetical protein
MKRRELILFAAAFLPPFILYSLTRGSTWALDTIYTIDSAEMVLASTTLGIDHPPGHPLYLILAHLFSLLPFAIPDEGVILCSVVSMSVAAACLAYAVRFRTGSNLSGLGAGLAFAFGHIIWFHATIAEVYAVQLAAVAGLYTLIALWLKGQRPRTLFAICFVLGLVATTNLLLAVLLVPGVVYLFSKTGLFSRKFASPLLPLTGLGFLILGLTPLLYIPIRLGSSAFISDFAYLNGFEPGSLRWYFWYFSAEEFTATRFSVLSLTEFPRQIFEYATAFIDNHSAILAALSAVGIYWTLKSLWAETRARGSWCKWLSPVGTQAHLFERTVLIGWAATFLPVIQYQVADREVFYMPSFFHLCVLAGIGLWRFGESINSSTFPESTKPWIFQALVAVGPLFLVFGHYESISAITRVTSLYEERETRFLDLPDSAIVTSTDDGRATRWKYWQQVRKLRPDVAIETMGRLAPRYQPDHQDAPAATGMASEIAPSLNVADRLRVLKGIRAEHPDRPLYMILDDRLPAELDHFLIRRSQFDPRLLRLRDKPPAETSAVPIPSTIRSGQMTFREVSIDGIELTGLDSENSRSLSEPVRIESNIVNGVIRRGEFVEIAVIAKKKVDGQYFAEIAFVNAGMQIPAARGFVASRTLEIAPDDLPVGDYRKDRFVIKIPGYIPPGPHTLVAAINSVTRAEAGAYKGKTLRRMSPVEADRPWAGQTRYQPIARIWIE